MSANRIQKLELENQSIYYWFCSHSSDALRKEITLSEEEVVMFTGFTHERRRKEFLAVRVLLKAFSGHEKIYYDTNGRPFLKSGKKISVSHSHGVVMLGVCNSEIGVDVEKISPKIERIKHKFLNDLEFQWYNSLETLTLIWSVKEAIFKLYSKIVFLEFAKDICVIELSQNEEPSFVRVKVLKSGFENEFSLGYFKKEGFIFTFTLID
ncbi:MAG: 4'-phosphopantetheinyl transferase superfamily protein [Flavobacteriales bacterium]|nr:4'-phosphopantetheinyl transferase superfamily protein [Flavobacteriales bacterium]